MKDPVLLGLTAYSQGKREKGNVKRWSFPFLKKANLIFSLFPLTLSRLTSFALVFTIAVNGPLLAANGTPAPDAPAAPSAPTAVTPPGTREPLIEVSVDTLEISDNNSNKLGILWGEGIGTAANSVTNNQLNFLENTVPALFNVGTLNRSQIAGQLDALIQTDQVRVLANPTLLTKSGFEANFLVGGEIPYPQVGQGGVSGVDYKKYGVSLKILPQLTPRQTIDAQINVSVTAPDSTVAIIVAGTSVNGISAREAGTKVEVKDGETVVLAGIKQTRHEKNIVRVPVLGSIPILGLLFRHKAETTLQTNLVFFVTFHLIKS